MNVVIEIRFPRSLSFSVCSPRPKGRKQSLTCALVHSQGYKIGRVPLRLSWDWMTLSSGASVGFAPNLVIKIRFACLGKGKTSSECIHLPPGATLICTDTLRRVFAVFTKDGAIGFSDNSFCDRPFVFWSNFLGRRARRLVTKG